MSSRKTPETKRPLKELILLGLALAVLTCLLSFYFLTIIWVSDHPAGSDFAKFYHSSRFFLEGKDIYGVVPVRLPESKAEISGNIQDTLHPNLNPPFATLLLAPAGLCSYPFAYVAWSLLSLILGLAAVQRVQETLFPNLSPPGKFGFLILFLAYFPTWISIVYGQFSLLLFFLLSSAWSGLRRGRIPRAGIFLGLATSLKLFAGLFLIFLLVRRQWRALAWTSGTIGVCLVSSLLAVGPGAYFRYIEILGEITWQSASWNASFQGYFLRVFGGSENVPPFPFPAIGQLLVWGCSLALVLGLIFVLGKGRRCSGPVHLDMGFALCCPAMLLLSPLGWAYYFPVLWLPFLAGWRHCGTSSGVTRTLLATSWIFSTMPHLLIPSPEIRGDWAIFVLSGSYFYALLLLVLTLVISCLHRPESFSGAEHSFL